jgi:hypothetical protein
MATATLVDGTGLNIHVYRIDMDAGDTTLSFDLGPITFNMAVITSAGGNAAGVYTQQLRLATPAFSQIQPATPSGLPVSRVHFEKNAGAPASARIAVIRAFSDRT